MPSPADEVLGRHLAQIKVARKLAKAMGAADDCDNPDPSTVLVLFCTMEIAWELAGLNDQIAAMAELLQEKHA